MDRAIFREPPLLSEVELTVKFTSHDPLSTVFLGMRLGTWFVIYLTLLWPSQLIFVRNKISSFLSFFLNEVISADLIAVLCCQGVHAGVLVYFPFFSSTPATANHCSEGGSNM
jgi:hypothetical protein